MQYGYKAVLELGGVEHELTVCTYSFERSIDENGDVASGLLGGNLYLSLADLPDKNILEWGIQHRLFKSGILKIYQLDEESSVVSEEVSFEGASCINLKMNYERDNANYFTTLLTISAENMQMGRDGNWINKNWTK